MKGSGVIEMNRMTAIEVKLDALMNKMRNQERIMHLAHVVDIVERNEQKSSAEEGLTYEGPYQVEEAQVLNVNRSYNFKPNFNLQTHYTPTLRNHENFSYGGGVRQGPQCRIFNNNMLHMGSKDNNSKQVREQKIKGKGDLIPLKIRC